MKMLMALLFMFQAATSYAWILQEDKDEVTLKTSRTAALIDLNSGFYLGLYCSGERHASVLSSSKVVDSFYSRGSSLTPITYRLSSETSATERNVPFIRHRSLFHAFPIKYLSQEGELLVSVPLFRDGIVTARFDLTGIDEAIAHIGNCKETK